MLCRNWRSKSRGLEYEQPVVLITGGLPASVALLLSPSARRARRWSLPVGADEAGKALVKELRSFGSGGVHQTPTSARRRRPRLVDKTVARFGVLDVAVNTPPPKARLGRSRTRPRKSFAATFETNVLGVVLSMKHEVRAMQPRVAAASSTSPRPMAEGAAGASIYVGAKQPSKHHQVGGARIAKFGNSRECRRAWPHGHRHATRFTGTSENKAAWQSRFRWVGSASPRRSPTVSSSLRRTKPGSLRSHPHVDGGHSAN